MNLRGQYRSSDSGYAMAVLLVAMSVLAILMSAAMPVWKQAARREKEAELVFRGEQIGRAIGLYQRKAGPGTLPPNIQFLVEQRYLRKKYKDPITNDDFVPLTQSLAAGRGGQLQPGGPQTAGRGGIAPPTPVGATPFGQPPGGATSGTLGTQQQGQQLQTGTPSAATGGMIGVTSKSKDKSIRLYKGRNHYNEWQFVFTPPTTAPGASTPGTVPGRGGRGVLAPQTPFGGAPRFPSSGRSR